MRLMPQAALECSALGIGNTVMATPRNIYQRLQEPSRAFKGVNTGKCPYAKALFSY
jgi:hypothetical protein